MEIVKKGKNIILAVSLALVLFAILYTERGVVFETVDDYNVMLALSGDNTGSPYWQLTYFNCVFACFISKLYAITDSVQWYSLIHVAFLFSSVVVIFYSVYDRLRKEGVNLPICLLCDFGLFVAFYLYPVQRMQFTTTAALLGAASCALLYSISKSELSPASSCDANLLGETAKAKHAKRPNVSKRVWTKLVVSSVLMIFCFLMRRYTGEGLIVFWLVGMLRLCLLDKQDNQRYWQIWKSPVFKRGLGAVLILVVCYGAFYIGNQVIKQTGDNANYVEYDSYRALYQDHPHPSFNDASQLYESVGWNASTYSLVSALIYIDRSINADAYKQICESPEMEQAQSNPQDSVKLWTKLVRDNKAARGMLIAFFGLFAASLLLAVVCGVRKARGRFVPLFLGVLVFLLFFGVSFVICLSGRWILRLFIVLVAPASISLLFLLFDQYSCLVSTTVPDSAESDDPPKKSNLPTSVVLLVVVGISLFVGGYGSWQQIESLRATDQISNEEQKRVEQYAMDRPDEFYVHDYSFTNYYNSYDPFRVYADRKPSNLMISGGSFTYTGNYYAQLRANGFDCFWGEQLLQDGVYFISDRDYPQHFTILVTYMVERYGDIAVIDVADLGNNIHVYAFRYE